MASPASKPTYGTPNWGELYTAAEAQAGHFTTAQAAAAGYSPQLLHKYLASGKILRLRRGVYRLVHFPSTEHEELVLLWLWAEQAGVFSHDTALSLHELSDALPAKIHMSVPAAWRERRLRVPDDLVLHHVDTNDDDREWLGPIPLTSVRRTLRDCVEAYVSPELTQQAIREARQRGLITRREGDVVAKLLDDSLREMQ